jgi:hypothetical protein
MPNAHVCVFDGTYYKMMLNDVGVLVISFCKIFCPLHWRDVLFSAIHFLCAYLRKNFIKNINN